MGCDIHAYVETTTSNTGEKGYWTNFGSKFHLDRNYGMFGFLAGVRTDDKPIVSPRGLPENLAFRTDDDAFFRISDEYADQPGYCSFAEAQRYETYGSRIHLYDGKPWKIDNPDWHTHSWLTPEEFDRVIAAYEAKYVTGEHATENRRWSAEYHALSAAMKSLQTFGLKVRLVFWFDN